MLHALLACANHHVAEHALPGEQRELLKHRSAVGTGPGDRLALHLRHALPRIDKAADDIEQRRFSAAGGAEYGNEGAVLDRQRDLRQRQMVLTAGSAKNLRDPIDLAHGSRPLARRRRVSLNIRPRWQYLDCRFSAQRTAAFPNFLGRRRSIAETRGAWRCCFGGRPTGTRRYRPDAGRSVYPSASAVAQLKS